MNFATRVLTWHRSKSRLAVGLVVGAVVAVLTAVPAGPANAAGTTASATRSAAPPPLTILTPSPNTDSDDIFLAPLFLNGSTGYSSGPEIVTTTGKVVWFHPLPTGNSAYDFRTQTYRGQRVLTWNQDGGDGGAGDMIYNDHFQRIATVNAGNGFATNLHEFFITPWNTALIAAVGETTANLTSIGGSADQQVEVDLVQEIDIATGKVLFQWNAADYVPYSDSRAPLPSSASQSWDWFHLNAIHLDADGNLLVSARNTWTIYKVNLHSGQVMWELGGKQSSFALQAASGQVLDSAGEIFSWQHDPESLGHGLYTVFDDESGGELPYSRAVTVLLDFQSHVATLVKSFNQPEGQFSTFCGNAQTTNSGNLFVGWGLVPYLSEFSPSGKLLFNAEFPPSVFSYRAYLLPWPAVPPQRVRVKDERSVSASLPSWHSLTEPVDLSQLT